METKYQIITGRHSQEFVWVLSSIDTLKFTIYKEIPSVITKEAVKRWIHLYSYSPHVIKRIKKEGRGLPWYSLTEIRALIALNPDHFKRTHIWK